MKTFIRLLILLSLVVVFSECDTTNSGGGTEIGNAPTITIGRLITGTLFDATGGQCTVAEVKIINAQETEVVTATPNAAGYFEGRVTENYTYRMGLYDDAGSLMNYLTVDNGNWNSFVAAPYFLVNYYEGESLSLGTITCETARATLSHAFTPSANPASQNDADGDGFVDALDSSFDSSHLGYRACSGILNEDCDGDSVASLDNCPMMSNADQIDSDGDLIGDDCDNCPAIQNSDQTDSDSDYIGDVCEDTLMDSDGDGITNEDDNCPTTNNADQTDSDGDGIGDGCSSDPDGDGLTYNDLCPGIIDHGENKDDWAWDGGDACDDHDGDGIVEAIDNCIDTSNVDQADSDKDGVGDVCE